MQKSLAIFNKIVQEFLEKEVTDPVAPYIPSNELFQRLDLELKKNPISEDEFESTLKELILASTRTASKGFFNQLYGGRNDKAVLGDLLAVILNNSMYTYKAAGAQIGVEKIVLREVCNLIGWDNNADGTFASGGSMTNLMSMIMGRDAFNNKIKNEGLNQTLIVYTSDVSHYSIPKNAAFTGVGKENVRFIPSDEKGRMIPSELEKTILKDLENGLHPIMVNATAGTTVFGAFDPIKPISKICREHDMWLHLDGAYCGSVIFSERYKHLINGVELVDSFSLNAHKMIGTPLTCSLLLVKDKAHLYSSFNSEADYLYQTDEDEYNLGKTSLQCGRRNDALKFWTLWKSVGTEGLETIVNHQFDLANVARKYVKDNPEYTLYSFDDSISICFNYKDVPAKKLCTALYKSDELLVSFGSFKGQDFVRLVTINAQNRPEDILNFFSILEAFVDDNQSLI